MTLPVRQTPNPQSPPAMPERAHARDTPASPSGDPRAESHGGLIGGQERSPVHSPQSSIPLPQVSIHREHPPSTNHQGKGNADHQYMILDPLALLLSEPVHEEAVLHMIQGHADGDAGSNGQRPQPGEKPEGKKKGAQGFGDHQQDS